MREQVIVAQAVVPTANRRVYPQALLEKAVADFQAKLAREGPLVGFLTQVTTSRYDQPALLVHGIRMDGDKAVAEVEWQHATVSLKDVEMMMSGEGTIGPDGTVHLFRVTELSAIAKR